MTTLVHTYFRCIHLLLFCFFSKQNSHINQLTDLLCRLCGRRWKWPSPPSRWRSSAVSGHPGPRGVFFVLPARNALASCSQCRWSNPCSSWCWTILQKGVKSERIWRNRLYFVCCWRCDQQIGKDGGQRPRSTWPTWRWPIREGLRVTWWTHLYPDPDPDPNKQHPGPGHVGGEGSLGGVPGPRNLQGDMDCPGGRSKELLLRL